jgi:hypothetical protein
MPQEQPKSPQNSAPPVKRPLETKTDAAHQLVQDAHNKYFQDLASIGNSAQQRFQSIQVEFERALENAWQTQAPNAVQAAQTEFQSRFQDACMEANPVGAYEEAYRDYKTAVQQAIASANVDELNFTDIAHLGQSLCTVSQMAMMMRMTASTGTGPSPFPTEGTSPPPPNVSR